MAPTGGRKLILLTWIICFCTNSLTNAWDTDDLEIFDAVEEINKNFYEVLGVQQSATSADIRKAYRRLSLQLHPDKNKEENAEVQFRQLVSVYEILRDEEKRKRYNVVLENGLPDWRQPIYYYRRVRKMGLLEFFFLICLITTVGQYIVMWSIYAERKFTLTENYADARKKAESKNRKARQEIEEKIESELERLMSAVPRPKLTSLWPFLFVVFLIKTLINSPKILKEKYKDWQEKQRIAAIVEEESEDEDVTEVKKQKKKPRSEYVPPTPVVLANGEPVTYMQLTKPVELSEKNGAKHLKEGVWTDEETALLAKAANKYPGGTPKRWDKIAEMVGRSTSDVIAKCQEIKGGHVMNLNVSLQGGTSKGGKKPQTLTDEMISKNTNVCADTEQNIDTAETEGDVQVRRRHKKVKKVVDRTLAIPQQSVQTDSNPGVTSKELDKCGSDDKEQQESATLKLDESDIWNRNQQTILEWALRQYPKGTDLRWEKIAEHIPGKSKEDCVTRFKYLADLVKKKKELSQSVQSSQS